MVLRAVSGGSGGGGGGSPGGSSGQVQYNNGGAFGGMSGTSWNDTNRALTITGATVTTSQPIFDLTQTWNAGAVTFTGWRLNVTNTASAATSLLMDLQIGGASIFNIRSDGATYVTGGLVVNGVSGSGPFYVGAAAGSAGYNMASGLGVGWTSSTTNAVASPDLILGRRAAANLRLGAADAAAPVAQTLSVQSVVTGTSNTAGQEFRFDASQGTGTGPGGSIVFRVAPAGSSGSAVNALSAALTIASDRSANFDGWVYLKDNRLFSGSTAGAAGVGIFNQQLNISTPIRFADSSTYGSTITEMVGEAANTLALRNGTAAQNFRVYNTFDGTNNEWLETLWSGNTMFIRTQKTGTGTERDISFTAGAGVITINGAFLQFNSANTTRWQINGSGHFIANTDNTLDIGLSGANRPRYIRAGTALVSPSTTVAGLPAAGTAGAGARSLVTDANATTFQAIVAGGGANVVPVYSDGTNWRIG